MRNVHVLLSKDEVVESKLGCGEKIVIVLDVLLATTTMVDVLKHGAKCILPVSSPEEAIRASRNADEEVILAGEKDANPIDGFLYPSPFHLNDCVKGKSLIMVTTNGTIALQKASSARRVYVSSLLNNGTTARAIAAEQTEGTIVIICSGNSGELSLEDFFGAGHFLACFRKFSSEQLELNDAARAALTFYLGEKHHPIGVLNTSSTGRFLLKNGWKEEVTLAGMLDSVDLLVGYRNGRVEQIGKGPYSV